MAKRKTKSKSSSKRGLTNQQRVFVEEYLTCWNASEAARRAKYRGRANQIGSRLLTNVDIAALIQKRLVEIAMPANEVLARLTDHARADMSDFVNKKTGDLDLAQAEQNGKLHLLKSYSRTKQGDRVELVDQQAALVHLGKHLKLFTDKVEHSGSVETPAQVIVYVPDNGRDHNPTPSGSADQVSQQSG